MKKAVAVLAMVLVAAAMALAAPAERYLHVRIDNGSKAQKVRVNVPLALAAQIIPAIDSGQLRDGKISLGNFKANGVNVRKILDALKTAPDGQFVTIQEPGQSVEVAKKQGILIVRVNQTKGERQNVEVTVPWSVAEALTQNVGPNELNVEAAIQALEKAGNMTLVTVSGQGQHIRIWIDSKSTDD